MGGVCVCGWGMGGVCVCVGGCLFAIAYIAIKVFIG